VFRSVAVLFVSADSITACSRSTMSVDSSDKNVTAQCPAGKKLIGGGAVAHAVSTWKAVAREAVAYAGNWILNAYAICANVAS